MIVIHGRILLLRNKIKTLMKKVHLVVLLMISLLLANPPVSFSQEYEFEWQPASNSVFGDVLPINNDAVDFVLIGPGDLPVFELDTSDIAFRKNNDLWYKGYGEHIANAQISYKLKCLTKFFESDADINEIEVRIRKTGGDYQYSTIHYYYSRPLIEIEEINIDGDVYSPETPIVIFENTESFNIDIRSWAKYGEESQSGIINFGNANINTIVFANNPEFSDPKEPQGISPGIDVSTSVNILDYYALNNGLYYGHNTLYFKARGAGSADESEVIEIPFFIFNFDIPQTSYCNYNQLYPLEGKPAGGKFNGECIVENTNMFNPSLAEGNATEVTYEYLYEGEAFTVTKTIQLNHLPEFEIEGPQQVCGWEHGATYNVSLDEPANEINWSVTEEAFEYFLLTDGSLFINWGEKGNGLVTATVTTENGCSVTKEYIVNIGRREEPKDSAYLILNDRLLICSDTSVDYYVWYQAGNNVALDTTYDQQNYYYLGFQPAATDSFYVETSYYGNECYTHSYFSKPENINKSIPDILNPLYLHPNPAKDKIYLTLPSHPYSIINLSVYNMKGSLVYNRNYPPLPEAKYTDINLGQLAQGVYIIRVTSNSFNANQKFTLSK